MLEEIAEVERQRNIFLAQRDEYEAETKRLYEVHEHMLAELAEVGRQRDVFLAQRDEYEAETKRLYTGHEHMLAEIAEVERQRDVFLAQRDEYEAETKRLYAGHAAMEAEINFWKFRHDETSKLHDQVVERKWAHDVRRQKYYCTFPFERIEILPRGEVYTCCSGWLKSGYNIGNIFEQDFNEIWNSERAKKLRYSVTCGDFEYCQEYCRCLMFAGQKTRLEGNDTFPVQFKNSKEFSYKSYHDCTIDSLPKLIALTCDETCNLQCTSCRVEKRVLTKEKSEYLLKMLITKVRPLLVNCRLLVLLGSGEVFASIASMGFLKTLDREEFSGLMIRINTNAQLFDKNKWNELENLHDFPLLIHVSIDGADKATYEQNRLGANWETLQKNMSFVAGLRKDNYLRELTVSFVVQKNNFEQMSEFVKLAKGWVADFVHFQYMTDWGTMSLEEYRETNVFHEGNPNREHACEILRELIEKTEGIEILHNIPGL